MLYRLIAFALALIAMPLAALDAQTSDPKMQLLFIGASPDEGAPDGLPDDLPIIAIDALPEAGDEQQAVFAARLRSNPVSTFVSAPSETNAQFEQFFLVTQVSLLKATEGYEISIGEERFGLNDFADRVSAVVDAFNPLHRRVGFIRVTDPADEFPRAISEIQTALNRIGFNMLVVMIGGDPAGAACSGAPQQALHYSIISGLADREPFGNADGVSTAGEVESYLGGALNRTIARDPACGPKYSLLIKSSNDPAQELVAYSGRSLFMSMETTLYNETFEAMFLMESQDKDNVENFLAQCLYCPNERALSDRLREMEDFARASALEADIWNRIKNDAKPERLAIYLKNCSLCAYREEVESRIAEFEAKVAAFEAEGVVFRAAMDGRDLDALRTYADTCIACTHQAEARETVAAIEADEEYQKEQASLKAALESKDPTLMRVYMDNCKICDGVEEISAALAIEEKRAEFSAPCLKLAAVPQLGGPRKLEAIDQGQAGQICASAAREFPQDGVLQTTLGRISQAAGQFDDANRLYAIGMKANVPSAFGLAAYSHYAPPQGGEIDLDTAEALAVKGAEMGDWLSQEILTVLYSKDLVPGKTPVDAFDIAENIANEGNALAQFLVGYYYLTGTGVDLSEERAAEWLEKAVGQGYTHAYSFLAELHEKGAVGGTALPEKAADLYWEALVKGDPTATDRLTTQLGSRDRDVIRIIQEKLRGQGVYRGTVDGIAGPGTIAAVRRYSESLTEQG